MGFDGLLGGWKRFRLFSTHVLFDSPNASRDSWIVETVARLLNVPSCVVSPDRRNPLKNPCGNERSIFITPSWYFDASRSSWLFGSGEMIPTIDGPAAFYRVLHFIHGKRIHSFTLKCLTRAFANASLVIRLA